MDRISHAPNNQLIFFLSKITKPIFKDTFLINSFSKKQEFADKL